MMELMLLTLETVFYPSTHLYTLTPTIFIAKSPSDGSQTRRPASSGIFFAPLQEFRSNFANSYKRYYYFESIFTGKPTNIIFTSDFYILAKKAVSWSSGKIFLVFQCRKNSVSEKIFPWERDILSIRWNIFFSKYRKNSQANPSVIQEVWVFEKIYAEEASSTYRCRFESPRKGLHNKTEQKKLETILLTNKKTFFCRSMVFLIAFMLCFL